MLAAQPAPEAVLRSDWERLLAAGVIDDIFGGSFDLTSFALDPPVSRSDSKGKIIDFARLAATRETWSRLLPQPTDPDTAVDVLRAASGGALKSRAFWVVREMRRLGLWSLEELDRYGYVPDGRVRKRAVRMGLVDVPEKADSFADMKAVSRGLHAVMRLAGNGAARLRPADQPRRRALRAVRRHPHGQLPAAPLPLAPRAGCGGLRPGRAQKHNARRGRRFRPRPRRAVSRRYRRRLAATS